MVRQCRALLRQALFLDLPQLRPDFVKLAEAYGATGLRATKIEEVVPTLERAFATADGHGGRPVSPRRTSIHGPAGPPQEDDPHLTTAAR